MGGRRGARMWPRGLDDNGEASTSGAPHVWPTKATAPPPSVILGAFANRNTHYKSGPGSNGRGCAMPHKWAKAINGKIKQGGRLFLVERLRG